MNIALCAHGSVGEELTKFVLKNKKNISVVIVRVNDDYKYAISSCCALYGIECIETKEINDEEIGAHFISKKIDIVFLLWWPDIVRKNILNSVAIGFVNLHPSMLPHNRGMHPYYWSIVEGTPAGVSIHFIDEKVDAGKLLCQKQIKITPETTGEKLYNTAQLEIIKLFKENYDGIVDLKLMPTIVDTAKGTFHFRKEINQHSCIYLNKQYKAENLINIIRARTFHHGESAYFYKNGKKYWVRISIEKAQNEK